MGLLTGVKNYEELQFTDDFMFGVTMSDRALCRRVIECLIGEEIGELQEIQSQKEFKYTSDGKPIRLDIYTQSEDTIYDAEMQNLNHKRPEDLELPRRTRFYQASIDMDYLGRRGLYRSLPDSRILFICTFDPFGRGLSRYTFKERCEEENTILLCDGTEKHFYNCTYQGNDISKDLRNFYDYIKNGSVSDELTDWINQAVLEARKNEKWRSSYMKERVLIMDAREEGREEGLKEGRAEGRAEERKRVEQERARAEAAEARVRMLEERLAALNA